MRLSAIVFASILSVLGAVAQTPPSSGGAGTNQQTKQQPQYLSEAEARRRGLIDDNPADDPPPSEECTRVLKEIDSERKASDRVLERGGYEPASLKDVYEQGMYYADKRIKAIDRSCLSDRKSRSHDFGRRPALQELSTNSSGCRIVAKDCKPTKHW